MKQAWSNLNIKDKIQYTLAVLLILSGIAMAFLSFFAIKDIATGTLIYIGQSFVAGGSILGVSVYFKDKLQESREFILEEIKNAIAHNKSSYT